MDAQVLSISSLAKRTHLTSNCKIVIFLINIKILNILDLSSPRLRAPPQPQYTCGWTWIRSARYQSVSFSSGRPLTAPPPPPFNPN